MLEKALSKASLDEQKGSLERLLQAVLPLRLSSLEQMDLNARGRLITTLARVGRQSKPAAPEAAEQAPAEEAGASEAPAVEAEAPSAEAEAPAVETAEAASGEAAPSEAPAADAATEAAAPKARAERPAAKPASYEDVMYLLGSVWRAAGDSERASSAYQLSGREPGPMPEMPRREARPTRDARDARPGREGREGRPERGERPARGERPPRADRPERDNRLEKRREMDQQIAALGDWKEQVAALEKQGRTRDAARIHERNESYVEALRLYEAGGEHKGALRSALGAKDNDAIKRLLALVKPDEALPILEKAGAYEQLMEHYVGQKDFANVARLYERARQFDQAGLAWERANKLSNARKAYERAKDLPAVNRLRDLEVKQLVDRGDRLGAAILLVTAGEKGKAVELLASLPPPKAYRFLQRVKLDTEAAALAQSELAKAEAENRTVARARWLELLGRTEEAAAGYEAAGRKEKAYPLYEKLGNLPKAMELAEASGHRAEAIALAEKSGNAAEAERLKALPPPPPREKPARRAEADADEADDEVGSDPSVAVQAADGAGSAPSEAKQET